VLDIEGVLLGAVEVDDDDEEDDVREAIFSSVL
jgi:hypothetical protein